jgi:hypothetical protein
MTSDESVGRLKALIAEAGVDARDPAAADVDRVWDVMRRFAAEPVDDIAPLEEESDGILAQYGTYDWGEGEHFEIEFVRQFAFNDADGEYGHMSQLHCQFQFEPTDELRALGSDDLWSFDIPLDVFFDQALALRGFSGVRRLSAAPLRLVVDYEDV